uniref:Integrase, catalytic region, zinc finger, CCHC-type, peptidase aspartic, catalytic n=1 Tax=Tanacetum cinerariifolium TaxID=118510 RepID=A0A6L2NBW5_TANCI|nr:hypothetical protein [Tanacetum cinerariifolium]
MNDKMQDLEFVKHKVKIAPHDYSKENFLATFTTHKQLTPEQIFWSQDLIKMKAEALKEQTTASRLIKALTVYPPNIHATLVVRVLPTKSQVIFLHSSNSFQNLIKHIKRELHQLGSLKGKGVLNKPRNVISRRKRDEIKRKNLLIENDNLIAECLSKEVFYVATNSELNVSRFTGMHVAHTIVEARCLELEAELSGLRDKIHNDNHNELVNRFPNLKVHHLNLQLKYQNLKDSFGNNPPTPAKDTPNFDSVFVIGKMQASLQGKDNVIKQLKKKIYHLQETRSEAERTLDFRALDSQITQLTEKVTVLQEQNDLFRAENGKIKQHYKELYDSIKIMRAKHIKQVMTLTNKNVNLKAQILNNVNSVVKDHVKPTVLAPGKYAIDVEPIPPHLRNNREAHLDYPRHLKERVNRCIDASGSQPRSNTKTNRISPAKGVNKMKVEEHPRTNKSHLRTTNHYRTHSYFSDAWTDNFRARIQSSSCSSLCTPTNKDLEILFQPMFDEYLEPPRIERLVSPALAVQVPVNSSGTPSSTTIDQDAPSPSDSPSSLALQSPSVHQGVAAESTLMEDNPVALIDKNPFINVFAPEPSCDASSSGDVSSAESTYVF